MLSLEQPWRKQSLGSHDELTRYFSNMSFKDGRLTLKSTGRYSESEPTQDVINLSWEVEFRSSCKARRVER